LLVPLIKSIIIVFLIEERKISEHNTALHLEALVVHKRKTTLNGDIGSCSYYSWSFYRAPPNPSPALFSFFIMTFQYLHLVG